MSTTMADPADVAMTDTPQSETTMADTVSTVAAGSAVVFTAAASTALEHFGAARDLDSGGALAEGANNAAITSFLERPPEIRNLIYKAMFEHDGPVTLEACGAREMSKWDAIRAISNRNILFTCKTIYQEAIGIMYSCNTWLITFGNVDDRNNGHIVEKVGGWLLALGRRMALLRNVQIDIMTDRFFQLLPTLVNVTDLVINIAMLAQKTKRRSSSPSNRPSFVLPQISFVPGHFRPTGMERSFEFDYKVASETLGLLLEAASSKKSTLPSDLRSLLRCWRTVKSVHVYSGSRIVLSLLTRFDKETTDTNQSVYEKDTTGHWLKVTPAQEVSIDRLLNSETISARIFDHVLQLEDTIVYELEEHTVLPGFNLSQTNQSFREALFVYYENTPFSIRVVVNPPERNKQQFASLHDLLNRSGPELLDHGFNINAELHLEIRLSNGQRLTNTRIDATELFEATASIYSAGVSTYTSRDCFLPGHRIAKKSLQYVRHQLLDALVRLLEAYPENSLLPRPTVYMNHQCDMVEARMSLRDGIFAIVRNEKIAGEVVSDSMAIESIRKLQQRKAELNVTRADDTTLLGCALYVAQTSLWRSD